jgi:hypothetical protein
MLLGWSFLALDANGRSGGIALGYNTRSINLFNSWGGSGHIGADIFSADLGIEIRLINVYGPCHHRPEFWDHF